MREGIRSAQGLDFYELEGHFIGDRTLQVGSDRIKGERVFIASGARPLIPPIKGLDQVDYLTNESVLELRDRPDSIAIVGGGYIGVEYGHFFAAMGSKVMVIGRNKRLVPEEESEVSELLKRKMAERMEVYTDTEVVEVRKHERGYLVIAGNRDTGQRS